MGIVAVIVAVSSAPVPFADPGTRPKPTQVCPYNAAPKGGLCPVYAPDLGLSPSNRGVGGGGRQPGLLGRILGRLTGGLL